MVGVLGVDVALLQNSPYPLKYMYLIVGLGWHRCCKALFVYVEVDVGWQRRWKTCQSLRELDNQGTFFTHEAVTQ